MKTASRISHVVFDFDGTLSWLRHGWPLIMISVFRDAAPLFRDEDLWPIIIGLNGQPTIRQMTHFADLVQREENRELDPEELRRDFQARLDREIAVRSALICSGKAKADDFVVFAARPLLEHLSKLGMRLFILSSTIEHRVKEEAGLLQLASFFDDIHGSPADPTTFTKMAVFEQILRADGIDGNRLLSFGDGPVEIANTKALGGTAIAVCSDEEHNGSGVMDPFKRRQLLDAGADVAIPDFRDAVALVDDLLHR